MAVGQEPGKVGPIMYRRKSAETWVIWLIAVVLVAPFLYGAGADEGGGGAEAGDVHASDGGAGETRADDTEAQRATDSSRAARADERRRMVERHIVGSDIESEAVLDAMRSVPRHEFVPSPHEDQAYANRPLPIGHGQTISQPYIVAYMTEVLNPDSDDVVLEVGTGSGYQAAVLAEIVDEVYTIEIIEPLARSGREKLERLGYDNVAVRQGDGYFGWSEHAPFDSVIVTAAAGHIPPPLVEQLRPGGRMVIPVGPAFAVQTLIRVEKSSDGEVTTEQLLPVRFVPMTGRVQEGQ
ncbi:MAG: protein-L-isoaspartate(D-aspartate) O-methyltransferase [Spirochaetota bacterium]